MLLLLLSPDPADTGGAAALLASLGHEVSIRTAAAAPATPAGRDAFDAVILDLAGGQDALRFLRKHLGTSDRLPVVCIADRRRLDASAEALRLGAIDIVGRPVTVGPIEAALGNAREFRTVANQGKVEEPFAEATPDGMFGASPAMREVLAMARRVAISRCAVLIIGERGTGREMVARTIHAESPARTAPFVKISCPGVSESELTTALSQAKAQTTVYLENLGELPLDLQARVEDRLRTSGADAEPGFNARMAPADSRVRFIAGAQPRLFAWVARGQVRHELVEALSTVRLDVPPLRQRSEDIPLLAMHFLKAGCGQARVAPKTFSRAAMTVLAALPWPGTASELRSLCDRLAVLVPRGVVLLEDLLAHVRFDGAETLGRRSESLRLAREQFERDYITATLQQHKGRMGPAAEDLGIERTNLYRKIKQLNIQWAVDSD